MQEYIANALRKPVLGISESNIDAMLVLASGVRVQPITHEVVVAAVILRRRHALSHRDATILAAAEPLANIHRHGLSGSHGLPTDLSGERLATTLSQNLPALIADL